EGHAAEHVEILRPVAGGPEIEIGVADAADDGFLVLQFGDEARGEIETIHHLGVAGRGVHGRALTCRRYCRRSTAATGSAPPGPGWGWPACTGARRRPGKQR